MFWCSALLIFGVAVGLEDDEKLPSLQEQFNANILKARELRGLSESAGESFTRRHKKERKERQRQKREARRETLVSPGCEPGDKLCDRRKRQEERRLEFERLKEDRSEL